MAWLRAQEKGLHLGRDKDKTRKERKTAVFAEKGERLLGKRDRKLGKLRAKFERRMERSKSDKKDERLASKLERKESAISSRFGHKAASFMIKGQKKVSKGAPKKKGYLQEVVRNTEGL
jgi:hypothetical protein